MADFSAHELSAAHCEALTLILDRLEVGAIHWVLTGSAGLLLQGVPVCVHDIDLQCDAQGAYLIESALKVYVDEPVAYRPSPRIRSHFGRMKIAGTTVEIMGGMQKLLPDGNWEDPLDPADLRLWLAWQGRKIPVLPLEVESRAYRLMGRLEKARLIEQTLRG